MPRYAPYGFARAPFNVTVPLAPYLNATTQQTLVLSMTLGFQFVIEKLLLIAVTAGAGAGASRVVNVRKGNATGTIAATATATLATTTQGNVIAGTVTASAASFGDGDTLTIEFPSGGTVFSAGQLELVIVYRVQNQRAA